MAAMIGTAAALLWLAMPLAICGAAGANKARVAGDVKVAGICGESWAGPGNQGDCGRSIGGANWAEPGNKVGVCMSVGTCAGTAAAG